MVRIDSSEQRVLSRRRTSDGDIILVRKLNVYDPMGGYEYVTWWEDERGNRFWGHYYSDLDEARDDFENR